MLCNPKHTSEAAKLHPINTDLNRAENGIYGSSNAQGQAVVEYVLLLSIAVSVAALAISQLVSQNSSSPGAMISWWLEILQIIGKD